MFNLHENSRQQSYTHTKIQFPEIQISKKTQKTRNHASYRKLTNIIKNFKVLKRVENPNSGKQR